MNQDLSGTLRVVGLIAVIVGETGILASEAVAVPRENQTEKEANLKGQASGELFNRWTFDDQKSEETPAAFSSSSVGGGAEPVWAIQPDPLAPSVPNI